MKEKRQHDWEILKKWLHRLYFSQDETGRHFTGRVTIDSKNSMDHQFGVVPAKKKISDVKEYLKEYTAT